MIAAVCAMRAQMTVTDLGGTCAPFLATSGSLRLAAQELTRDITRLSCCAV